MFISKFTRALLSLNILSSNIDRLFVPNFRSVSFLRFLNVLGLTSLIIVFSKSISSRSWLLANKPSSSIVTGLDAKLTFFSLVLFLKMSLGILEILFPFNHTSSKFTALSNIPLGKEVKPLELSLITLTFAPKSFSISISYILLNWGSKTPPFQVRSTVAGALVNSSLEIFPSEFVSSPDLINLCLSISLDMAFLFSKSYTSWKFFQPLWASFLNIIFTL